MQYLGMKCRHFSDRSRQPRLRQGQCGQGQRASRPNQGLGPFGNRCHGHAFGKSGRSGCVCGFAHRRARKEDHGLARNLLHGPPGRDEPMQFHGSTRLGGFQSVLNKDIGKARVMVDWQNVTAWDASILDTVVDNLIAERKNATPRASRFKTSTKTSRGQAKGRRRHARTGLRLVEQIGGRRTSKARRSFHQTRGAERREHPRTGAEIRQSRRDRRLGSRQSQPLAPRVGHRGYETPKRRAAGKQRPRRGVRR